MQSETAILIYTSWRYEPFHLLMTGKYFEITGWKHWRILGKDQIIYITKPFQSAVLDQCGFFFPCYIIYCPGLVFLLVSFLNYQHRRRIVAVCISLTFFGDFQLCVMVLAESFLILGTSMQSILAEQMFGSTLTMCFKCTK